MIIPETGSTLEDIRREIDAIDDGIVDLLVRRTLASEQVRVRKAQSGPAQLSPLRPGREAQILQRLLARAGGRIDPQLLVRLWRVILSASTLAQAPVTVHASRRTLDEADTRLQISQHFCAFPLRAHASETDAVAALGNCRSDLAVVEVATPWAEALADGQGGAPQVVASLPAIGRSGPPLLLVLGYGSEDDIGDGETIIRSLAPLTAAGLPEPSWQTVSGHWQVAAYPGHWRPDTAPFAALMAEALPGAVAVVGHLPSSLRIES